MEWLLVNSVCLMDDKDACLDYNMPFNKYTHTMKIFKKKHDLGWLGRDQLNEWHIIQTTNKSCKWI